jgi:hypothetical protein
MAGAEGFEPLKLKDSLKSLISSVPYDLGRCPYAYFNFQYQSHRSVFENESYVCLRKQPFMVDYANEY